MKKVKKLSATIGIPAYNEEANIISLLSDILSQKETNFSLTKIIVVSDASTDNTDKLILSFKDKRISFIRNKVRSGQIYCQNKIFALTNTDIIILLEADTKAKDRNYISNLIKPLMDDPTIGYLQGNEQPLLPRNFFESVFYSQFKVFYNLNVNNEMVTKWFCSGRGGRAFTKQVYKHLNWPFQVPEDSYALLWCKMNKIKWVFQKNAIRFYRGPQTFGDLIKINRKLKSGEQALLSYFSQKDINNVYHVPRLSYLKTSFQFLIRYPLKFTIYLFINKFLGVFLFTGEFTDLLPTAQTTKVL